MRSSLPPAAVCGPYPNVAHLNPNKRCRSHLEGRTTGSSMGDMRMRRPVGSLDTSALVPGSAATIKNGNKRFSSRTSSSNSSSSSSNCVSSPHTLQPIALDVEYTHICLPDGKQTSLAAWICMVAPGTEKPLLKAYCRHPMLDQPRTQPGLIRSVGGVRMASLHGALPLADAAARVTELWQGKLLVGHGVMKDLASLGLDHTQRPSCQQVYDTVTFPKFQGKGGAARSLQRLAKDFLGKSIQTPGRLHDPEQDARAVLRLYTEHARSHLIDTYDDLVQHYMQQYMSHAEGIQDEGEGEEEEGA